MVIANSSTSNSDNAAPEKWKKFVGVVAFMLPALTALFYGFVLLMDPYGSIPFSPRMERLQVADQQRLFYPMLARKAKFDSAIIGNSNIRLLRPDILGESLQGTWVNLAINAASSWEQEQIFNVFVRNHQEVKNLLIGMDYLWCYGRLADKKFVGATREEDFPAWLYDEKLTNNLPPLNLGSIEHSWRRLATAWGLQKNEFGEDGYTFFTDPESEYDLTKARKKIYGSSKPKPIVPVKPPVKMRQQKREALAMPALNRLEKMLAALPDSTRIILLFVPYHSYYQARPGSRNEIVWGECKRRVSAIAGQFNNAYVLDFMIKSEITRKDSNYWDFKHYRVPMGDRISSLIGAAIKNKSQGENFRVLSAPDRISSEAP